MKNRIKNLTFILTLIFIINAAFLLSAEIEFSSDNNPVLNDGPYLFYGEDSLTIYNINNGIIIETKKDITDTELYVESLGKNVEITDNFPAAETDFLSDKFLLISDIHGQYDLFRQILIENKIINENNDWIWNDGDLIVVGDLFDRGPKVTEIFWLLYSLEQQAEKLGGKVICLLGNHELMIFENDLRYIHSKYQKTAQLAGIGYNQLYENNSLLGRWLRSFPVIIKINNTLIVHAGISPELQIEYSSWEPVNSDFLDLLNNDWQGPNSKLLLHSFGPFWYRGYFQPVKEKEQLVQQEIDMILSNWNIDRIIVGHTSFDQILSLYNDKIFVIDTSIKRGIKGEALLFDSGDYYRINNIGEKIILTGE